MLTPRQLGLSVLSAFGALLLAGSASLQAQTTTDPGTDVRYHRFQPKVSPEAAAQSATDRSVDANGISVFATAQMNALQQEKNLRTPAQQKIDSNLLYTERMLQGRDAAPGVAYLETGVEVDANNNLVVDMIANVSDALLAKLSASGVTVLSSFPAYRSIRAIVPAASLEGIAAFPEVLFLSPRQESIDNAGRPQVARVPSPLLKAAPDAASRAARLRKLLKQAQGPRPFVGGTVNTPAGQGKAETEGDYAHQTLQARGTYGVTGAGLKIGVISNGVTTVATSQGTGDVPPTCGTGVPSPCLTVLPGQAGSGDEGTAMLEIIHDMVPGANLYFASSGTSIAGFATNIRNLQAAGCTIIVDDVGYYVETPFQNGQAASIVSNTNGGVVIQAISDVVAAGAMYFTSAANSGSLDAGTSGTYEGDFNPIASAAPLPTTGYVHNFGNGVGYDSNTSTTTTLNLFWADPLGASTNDYDLYLLNSAGTAVVASSTNIQNGTQDPYEQIYNATAITAGTRLVVYQKPGAANRFFHLSTNRGTLAVATAGEVHGHSAAAAAYSVAATPAATPYSSSTPTGPYPGPFTSTNKTETFSSDGLRRIFFNSDSTPITAGNFSSTGGTVLNKPDITAADGVSVTGVGGFGSPFYGTSAAAPAAASVAALVVSAKPGITPAQVQTALTSTAIDILAAGYDRDSGAGIVMALPAIQSTGAVGGPNVEFGTITATENPGNGNGAIEAGEGALLAIQLKNTSGVQAATAITATLTTATAGIVIKQPATSGYADLAAGAGAENGFTNFAFTVTPAFTCGQSAQFSLNIAYNGGQTKVLTFSVPIGILSISNTLGATPSVPVSFTFTTGTETNRISRSGVASACGTAKTYPGAVAGATHVFDSYAFQACSSSCITPVLTSSTAGANLFAEIYTPGVTPSNLGAGYLGDAGTSTNTQSFGVNVTAGTTYAVVIADVNGNPPSTGIANTYTLQVPVCAASCSAYPLPVANAQSVMVAATTVGGTANASINSGSYDPNGGAITLSQSPAGPYPLGTTSVILTVTNKNGAFAQATASVTVVNPTTAVAANAATINYGTTPTTLTATITYAGAQPTGAITFQVDGGTTLTAGACTVTGGSELCSVSYPTGTLAVGPHTLTVTAGADANYTAASGMATLTVVDTLAGFSVTGIPLAISPATAQTATVRAVGASGATYTAFTGTVTLSSNDPLATFNPATYTFAAADAGVKTFTITFNTAGTRVLTASSGALTGAETGIRVGGYIWAVSNTDSATRNSETGATLTLAASFQPAATFGGVAFDAGSQSYRVVNTANSILRTSNTVGAPTTLTGGGLNAPTSIAVDGASLIWVANSGNNSVSVFSGTSAVTPATGFGTASLTAPSSLAIDNTGSVWVTNRSAGTVTHLFGAATPVVTPLANAAGNATLGVTP